MTVESIIHEQRELAKTLRANALAYARQNDYEIALAYKENAKLCDYIADCLNELLEYRKGDNNAQTV